MHNARLRSPTMRRRNPVFRAKPQIALARAPTKQTVQIADVSRTRFLDPLPGFKRSQDSHARRPRTVVAVPLLQGSELVGVNRQSMPGGAAFTENKSSCC